MCVDSYWTDAQPHLELHPRLYLLRPPPLRVGWKISRKLSALKVSRNSGGMSFLFSAGCPYTRRLIPRPVPHTDSTIMSSYLLRCHKGQTTTCSRRTLFQHGKTLQTRKEVNGAFNCPKRRIGATSTRCGCIRYVHKNRY